MNYRNKLISGEKKIAVWGTGYIGLSTMAYFSKKKINCIGYDVDEKKVKNINKGILPIKELKEWFGFEIKSMVRSKHLKATNNIIKLHDKNICVHFIAIPTEKDGKPFFSILFKVLKNIVSILKKFPDTKPMIIIEESSVKI